MDGELPENAGEEEKNLRNLLKYIGKSTKDNVTDDVTGKLNEIVHKIKEKKDVGIRYMKSWEREKELRDEGIALGRDEGRIEGREEERANTERERKRADTAENRASIAEARVKELEALLKK